MTEILDPLHAADRIAGDYIRYLRSAFAPHDPAMRADFDQQLADGRQLTRGPILQAVPPYQTRSSVGQLIDEGVLHRDLRSLHKTGFGLDRPLYAHQERAIRKLAERRNLVVATGTGSGKTESFLLPILDALLRERDEGSLDRPGVRALLLYPMNALANDQQARLRDLLAPFPDITFGRYVGDTEHTRQKGLDQFRLRFGGSPPPNELVCRDDMKARPPHVLVTNFAMLEYLLLRPEDQTFFDGPTGRHWRFVVLDEVHVYDGARGAEIGMLLRRVRDRVVRSERGRLTCIGTSATLGKGDEDRPRLVHFARQLFDETFEWVADDPHRQDIVEAERDDLVQGDGAGWFCPEDHLVRLRDRFRSGASAAQLAKLIAAANPPPPAPDETPAAWLGRALIAETHVVALQHLLTAGSVDITEAANQVMDGGDRAAALAALVDLCVGAEAGPDGRSLLPARWHFLLRALEGAFTCLDPDHPSDEPRLRLSRHRHCPACAESRRQSTMFETAVCRRCGAQYLVGEEHSDEGQVHLGAARTVAEHPLTFLLADHTADIVDDEDETATGEAETDRYDPAVICVRCGAVGQRQVGCGCHAPVRQLKQVHPTEKGRPIRRCAACGGRTSGASIVQRFITGSDAPVAVIATSLYQELPPVERIRGGVGDGRKLLSFADSRQDAAFFAPYLERTYNRAVQRRLLWQVMSDAVDDGDEVLRMADLRAQLKNKAIACGIASETDEDTTPDQQARHWLYAEILSTDRQQNLEGVGLAEIAVPIPTGLAAPPPLLELSLDEDEAFDLVRVLLDSVRRARAVTVDSKVNLDDPIFEGRPPTGLRGDQSETGVLSWNPSRGSNQRVAYLAKVLDRLGRSDVDAAGLLAAMWSEWIDDDPAWEDVLVREQAPYGRGVARRLQAGRLEFRPITKRHRPGQCDACRQIWWRSVRGVCPGVNCAGTVTPLDDDPDAGHRRRDHYRELYTSLSPIGLRVEEHTAQLTTDTAAERQQQFIAGRINALSCSTTFELGVDVGQIQAVLMRNVPPTAANYVQRAGRAGRRAGSPALVVTFAQRRSHDQHFFQQPFSMIDGHVAAPVVNVENPAIVRRHINALAFAEFVRGNATDGQDPYKHVDAFFLPANGSPAAEMVNWLRAKPEAIGAAVERIVPDRIADHPDLDVASWGWVDGLDGDPNEEGRGRMELAGREIRRELAELDAEIAIAYEEKKGRYAVRLEVVRKTVARVRTIDRLARAGVLPKYGFPVDVVSMDLREEARVALDRDLALAIADFALGNQIVADKRVWTSTGLKVEPGLTLLAYRWGTCRTCGARWTWLDETEHPPPCPACDGDAPPHGTRLIQPRFGFRGEDTGRRPGDTRPPRTAFTNSFFDEWTGTPPTPEQVTIGTCPTEVRTSRNGRITVVNQGPAGQGYLICRSCGHMAPSTATVTDHSGPRGVACKGSLRRTHLGHWYLTDTMQIIPRRPFAEPQALSTLNALLAATEDVGIAQADVNGAAHPTGVGAWSFVLFDAVPGGAGHARRLRELLPDLFAAARRRVARCDCGPETSCYACLRSYRNQSDHERLERRLALDVFDLMGVQ